MLVQLLFTRLERLVCIWRKFLELVKHSPQSYHKSMISYNYKVVVHFNNLKNTKFCIFFKVTSPPCFWSGPPLLWTWQLNRPSTPPYILYYILLASDPKRWPGVFPYLLLHCRRSSTLAQRPSSSSRPRREQPQVADFSTDGVRLCCRPPILPATARCVRIPHLSSLLSSDQRS